MPVGPSPPWCFRGQPTLTLGAMTTTTTNFKGVDHNSRNSSRVLQPPGGGSNFSLGFDEPTEQRVRKNKMASNIFGTHLPSQQVPSLGVAGKIRSRLEHREVTLLKQALEIS